MEQKTKWMNDIWQSRYIPCLGKMCLANSSLKKKKTLYYQSRVKNTNFISTEYYDFSSTFEPSSFKTVRKLSQSENNSNSEIIKVTFLCFLKFQISKNLTQCGLTFNVETKVYIKEVQVGYSGVQLFTLGKD